MKNEVRKKKENYEYDKNKKKIYNRFFHLI